MSIRSNRKNEPTLSTRRTLTTLTGRLECLTCYKAVFDSDPPVQDLKSKLEIVDLWSLQMLNKQIGLSVAGSDRFDGHQLAWALCIILKRTGRWLSSETLDLVRAALQVFFGAQTKLGTWPRYQAMFHYPNAGNAYPYDLETLSELLKPAMVRDERRLRESFRPYWTNLVNAWRHLEETALQLEDRPGAIGWCSGHHVSRTKAESWATASAYTFLQVFRAYRGSLGEGISREGTGRASPQPRRSQ